MTKKSRKTLGAIVSDLSLKQESNTVIDVQRELHKEYLDNLKLAINRGFKRYPNNFFVEVQTKAEKLLANTFRNFFIDRYTCPTPNYDQTVFRYNRQAERIEYIWTIPDRETCFHLKEHALEVVKEERELLSFILRFDDGSLFKLMKQYNNEKYETPEIKE